MPPVYKAAHKPKNQASNPKLSPTLIKKMSFPKSLKLNIREC